MTDNVIPKLGADIDEFPARDVATHSNTLANPKRGKDIKAFEALPPDVQQTIDSLSMVDGKIDKTVKANRTAIAINYQHLFPDRFNSTGVAI